MKSAIDRVHSVRCSFRVMESVHPRLLMAAAAFSALLASCDEEPAPTDIQQTTTVDTTVIIDSRTEWLARNAINIRSVNPSDLNFQDLEQLRASIGDSRIVMLGEESHGDGTAFLAKARLIKFLHQQMGFDVLAFESGFYDCHKAWELMKGGASALTTARRGIFDIWAESNEVQPVIDYLGEAFGSGRPLELAGFDCQFSAGAASVSSASTEFLIADLTRMLNDLGSHAPQAPEWSLFIATLDSLVRHLYYSIKPSQSEQMRFFAQLKEVAAEIDSLVRLHPTAEGLFWIQLMRSITTQTVVTMTVPHQGSYPPGTFNIRDDQMAENLLWLERTAYPNRKIIVWAASSHIMRNQGEINTMEPRFSFAGVRTMGEGVWKELGTSMYALGFTAYEGSAGIYNEQSWNFGKANKESLENLLRSAGFEHAIVDFRSPPSGGDWLNQVILSRPLGYGQMKANWTRIFDGMVFTRLMAPSTKSNRK